MPSKIDRYNARHIEPRFEKQPLSLRERYYRLEPAVFEPRSERQARKAALKAERAERRELAALQEEEQRMVQEELVMLPDFGIF
ncbi:hypothetical protein HGG70_05115 [Rhodobacteraceae bacterium R_SAG4]|nr:hypothetical protein [Rhodobacteraceae bacterium R_SAG4]